jgi:hypothetical protein
MNIYFKINLIVDITSQILFDTTDCLIMTEHRQLVKKKSRNLQGYMTPN